MERRNRVINSLRQPVPSWAFLLVVLGLVFAMLLGYSVINSNTKSVKDIVSVNVLKSTKRDTQLCDVAHVFQDIRIFVPPEYFPRVRDDIDKFLVDINTDKAECYPKTLPKALRATPEPSKSAQSPLPQVTVTKTIITPEDVRTVTVSPTFKATYHKKHKKAPKKSLVCMLPTPAPPIPPIIRCK